MNFLIRALTIFLILFQFINISSEPYSNSDDEKIDPGYEKLLKWGLSHNLSITEKIRFIKEKDTKQILTP